MGSATAKKILVVEDDKDILQLVKLYLENEGFRTITAANGAEALKLVKAEHPDLIVLDLMLPEIDGLEVCRKLRVAPQTAMLPIIMLRQVFRATVLNHIDNRSDPNEKPTNKPDDQF